MVMAKITSKKLCYFACWILVFFLVTVIILVICLPNFFTAVYSVKNTLVVPITLEVTSVLLLCSCGLLHFGIHKESENIILCWLLIMLLTWKINLAACLISLIKFVTSKNTSKLKDTFYRAIALVLFQAAWLALIGVVWNYWRSIATITDIPSYIQYVISRRHETGETGTEIPPSTTRGQQESTNDK